MVRAQSGREISETDGGPGRHPGLPRRASLPPAVPIIPLD